MLKPSQAFSQQRGAALIIGLILIAVASLVTVTAMRGTHVQEMMVSNQRNQLIAALSAEAGGAEFSNWISAQYQTNPSKTWPSTEDALTSLLGEHGLELQPVGEDPWGRWALDPTRSAVLSADSIRVAILGNSVTSGVSVASAFTFVDYKKGVIEQERNPGPFEAAIIGCESVKLKGSGNISSTTGKANVMTVKPGAPLELTGHSPITGDVFATGAVTTDGSSWVTGDIHASGDVLIKANAPYGGGIFTTGSISVSNTATFAGSLSANQNVTFTNGARVDGSVAAGNDVRFNHTDVRVGGNTAAGHAVTTNKSHMSPDDFVAGNVTIAPLTPNAPVSPPKCDPLDISEVMGSLNTIPSNGNVAIGNYPLVNWEASPQGLKAYDETWNVKKWVDKGTGYPTELIGNQETVIRTNKLDLTNGSLTVKGGDVVLYVNGDLTLGTGGGPGIVIESGSTLTVFTTGKTVIGSAIKMPSTSALTDGRPTFALFSSYADTSEFSKGVVINGDSRLVANVYAPFANVSVAAGGGLYGSARGKTVEVAGGAGITFDGDIRDWGSSGSADPGDEGNAIPLVTGWR
ncbi:pilus assembly PilX N-terminal domain-containing protein [Thiocapsa rosea]|uniref:PilX-like prepilin protein n=1 Tax=Thiocapsa rosea TaxID=69360 RepID=A0A495VEH0_9GAMM|nr:pilus assembly PilX N-terminal domain-containing protein [Thiocapsa rosea]RKT46777.1 PilX-like prepilin protein [Thiocapsa rosea]